MPLLPPVEPEPSYRPKHGRTRLLLSGVEPMLVREAEHEVLAQIENKVEWLSLRLATPDGGPAHVRSAAVVVTENLDLP